MKKILYSSLFVVALLSGCGTLVETGETDDDIESNDRDREELFDESDSSIEQHNAGTSCLSCHGGSANGAEEKYFRSGVTLYSSLNSSTPIDGYSVSLVMQNTSDTIKYKSGRGLGNANSGLYDTRLDGYTASHFTVKLLNSQGAIVGSSGSDTHDTSRLDCNSCHSATGTNGAPGRVTPNMSLGTTPVVVSPPTSLPSGTLSFANNVLPILNTQCASCHGTSGNFSITTSTTAYSGVTPFINTTSPTSSVLLQKGTGVVGHGGGNQLGGTTSVNYITIRDWITQGALNN